MRDGFDLRSADGELRTVDVPLPGVSRTAAEELFEEGCRAVAQELHGRMKAKAECREWVQTVCYEFLSRIISYGHAALFEERITRLERDRKGSTQVNPFQRGLLAIFAHEKGLMNEAARSYCGKRLWYAYRHYVPSCFLMGFLHEVWSGDAEAKVARNHIEPQFEQWICFERANDPRPELRGTYPAPIEDKVALIQNLVPIVTGAEEAKERFRAKRKQMTDQDS